MSHPLVLRILAESLPEGTTNNTQEKDVSGSRVSYDQRSLKKSHSNFIKSRRATTRQWTSFTAYSWVSIALYNKYGGLGFRVWGSGLGL